MNNLEAGLKFIQEGRLHQADMQFEAEFTQSPRPSSKVFKYHGMLLLKIGNYRAAIDKFDSYLANHPKDVICLLGKEIALDLLHK